MYEIDYDENGNEVWVERTLISGLERDKEG